MVMPRNGLANDGWNDVMGRAMMPPSPLPRQALLQNATLESPITGNIQRKHAGTHRAHLARMTRAEGRRRGAPPFSVNHAVH